MLKLEYKDYTLDFKFDAGTSRGILRKHHVVYLKIYQSSMPDIKGYGEAAPLVGLSPETVADVLEALPDLAEKLEKVTIPIDEDDVWVLVDQLVGMELPSLRFALETAFLDLIGGGKMQLFDNDFTTGSKDIPINGLIWMGEESFMKTQISEKLNKGFKCIKLKVGAIDFEQELRLIEMLRKESESLMIRVDANGAFPVNEVFARLTELAKYGVHSIEQPIMPGQWEAMQLICKRTPVPIALDEELIGVAEFSQKQELLKMLRPQYIILKPTLLGGFKQTLEWIRLANQMNIGWWLTSALESNIGLNAVSQFAGNFSDIGYQGLGTGQLYSNNISSPLCISGAYLGIDTKQQWDLPF
ncbi:o-succinylbenzoate synthase [Marinoscillum furvescens]|uniref:O-succinylbenzoate synthase n=1 Tax=Marinoscillum furvescens DSM 4134 TaxID=1122208 RepID=A0A3D9L127_MARFU|nr:o-succinylbenzoate synthase [Marinoscillum furvescens]RED97000.1 o-succinylbenzoate synthase [Marinoscillum furvescens DSM 4134]